MAAAGTVVMDSAVGVRLLGAELAVLVSGAEIDAVDGARDAGAIDLAAVPPLAEGPGVAGIERAGCQRLASEAPGDREQSRIAKIEAEPSALAAGRIEPGIKAVDRRLGSAFLFDRGEQIAGDDRVDRQAGPGLILGECRAAAAGRRRRNAHEPTNATPVHERNNRFPRF